MKKLYSVVVGAVVAVCAMLAFTVLAGSSESLGFRGPFTGLDAVALNAAAGSRTFAIDTRSQAYGQITFWFYFDYTANAGIISLTCTGGPTTTDNAYTLTVCDSASTEGECTAKTSGIFKSAGSLSADTKWDGRMYINGALSLSCVAAHSGTPGATDTITVKYVISE
jgi:hypothetical protein